MDKIYSYFWAHKKGIEPCSAVQLSIISKSGPSSNAVKRFENKKNVIRHDKNN